MPALTDEQEEAVVRKWACKQLKDSRLLQLPRELACLVTMYAADAAVDNYKNSERMCAITRFLNTLGSWDNQCLCGKPLIGINGDYDDDVYFTVYFPLVLEYNLPFLDTNPNQVTFNILPWIHIRSSVFISDENFDSICFMISSLNLEQSIWVSSNFRGINSSAIVIFFI